ncbi:MAG TPA: HlyD family efflux transporter periplasmic adaptor subunit [Gemmataceae bacterium]|nr:HlyD family efflux transporter periplasmic adaptor subunit [Gemmataceae bacterium]
MNTTKWFLLLGLLLLLAGVGAATIHYRREEPVANASGSASRSRAGSVSDGSPAEGVVCTGYVDLEHGIRSLAPLYPGRVAEIVAKEGQHVEAGAVILRLEDQDARFQVEAAEAAVMTAEVQVEEALKLKEQQRARLAQQQAAVLAAGYRLDAARQTLRRKEDQLKKNVVPIEEVSTTRAEVKALEQQEQAEREKLAELRTVDPALTVRKAEAQLKLSRIQRDRASRQFDECTLKAPVAGTVQHISVGAGDIATGNPPISGVGVSPVVRFAPDEPPLVRAEVDQEFVDRIQVGQTALIRDDTHSGASWRGKVQRVAGWFQQRRPMTLDPSAFTDVRTAECLIIIDPGQPPPRLGQRMRVMIGRVPSSDGD